MKVFVSLKFLLSSLFAFLCASLFSIGAFAQAPDYTTITGAVSFTGVITAILAIGAILMGVYVVWKGVKMVIGMLRGG